MMFDLSICLIIKDEGEYLPEWLDWHIAQGIEHFYIYDNGSVPPVEQFIPERYRSFCTVYYAPEMTQMDAYNHCLAGHRTETNWIAFIDTDEFIRVLDHRPVQELLHDIPDEADAIALPWVVYGADGQIHKSDAPVRERFRTIVNTYPRYLPSAKCIVRTQRVYDMSAHWPVSHGRLLYVVNARGKHIRGPVDPALYTDVAVIDHYFTRSLEEWKEKINRGSCDPLSQRKFDMFYIINPDMKKE